MEPKVSELQPSGVDASDVRAFVRVVDSGSVTGAARALGESKGSVSRRLSRLERALGAALVDRTGRRVSPTEDGLVFRARAGAALDLLDDAVDGVRDLRGVPTGNLRVTAPLGIAAPLLGPLLGPFVERWPAVRVEVVVTDAVLSFGRDRIDCALRLSRELPDSSLVAHKLTGLRGRFVASPAYVARYGAPTHPDELASHRLLLPPVHGTSLRVQFAPVHGDGPPVEHVLRGHLLSHDTALLLEAAVAGAGITFAMPERVQADLDSGRLVQVLPAWRTDSNGGLYLLTAGGPLPAKTRAFRDFVRSFWRDRAEGCAGG